MTAAHEILAGQHDFLCRVARNVGFSEDDLSAALVVNVIFRQYEARSGVFRVIDERLGFLAPEIRAQDRLPVGRGIIQPGAVG